MTDKKLKIVFWGLSVVFLLAVLIISRDAGISGDEEVHYKHSEMVYNYFKTLGKDKSALDTPKTHLQYYGQSFDNFVTILIHVFNIDDVYGFRHLMNSFAGWLIVLTTGLFAIYLSGYRTGIIVVLLFAMSPRFLGHLQNNLKDIPFALAYVAGVFLSLQTVFSVSKPSKRTIALLVLSIAASIGIRAGGILLVIYLWFFTFLYYLHQFFTGADIESKELFYRFKQLVFVSVLSYFIGLLLWPYALTNPFLKPWQSYQIMTNFPTTLRQIFNGGYYWSDYLPWFYLPKYMLVTIPLVVLFGVSLFLVFSWRIFKNGKVLPLSILIFTIVFPPVFVILKHANLYGAWRHFIFIYPGIVLLAAMGFSEYVSSIKKYWPKIVLGAAVVVMAVHPVKFMAANHPYYYLYFNEFTGGLKGAYGKYETDYYYHSMREGTEWLINHLNEVKPKRNIRVGGNFPIQWFFRFYPNIDFSYFQYTNRSNSNWDYAIVGNSYIHPEQLKKGNWPPGNAIHTVYADGVPICTVLKRQTYDDYRGIKALEQNNYAEAEKLLAKAAKIDPTNELIYFKLARALLEQGKTREAVAVLKKNIEVHPEYEPALLLMGTISEQEGNSYQAIKYYGKVIETNKKYFVAYIKLANLYRETNVEKAREVLKACIRVNPHHKEAILALAGTYDATEPEIALKYRELANSIN
ncbi:MAG: tetratricopeptide repeat protein [Prolixibacteraceae bacterium]|jgi:hypothetical protein|nr:tetratricopeptide repeat protein [Prolixibacteraceae bacterium]